MGLHNFLQHEFGGKLAMSATETPCGTGAFEVTAGAQLIHSKLTMGHGKCQTDEELENILDKIRAFTG
eukprot:CAMPEP_0119299868 /NCGR_PEP_ID=MMETSP1333-20130426/1895_1 /TAXON_ID=418940 /ORGANISM="Scyphosphaera apsteinii, Strain RCC1455" /LENGTH=67 /DNA_ID=CAMNT_0007301445 /DNA_START=107 /DNA_END=310 /DNA_ORIENTATION=+